MNKPEHDPNIYQRINKVRSAVTYIQKDTRVQGQYNAVTHDAVTAAIRPQLIENGIVIVPAQVSGVSVDSGQMTKSGTPIIRYEASYEVRFVNVDSPADYIAVPMHAHAMDQGDKAPGKACSYAVKYAMLKLFSIETGESEERREDLFPRPISEEQAANIEALIEEVNADKAKFLKWCKVAEIAHIQSKDYERVVKALESKR